jgi:CDP-diacylglycerol--serine O-phosphatidyltransferase
VDGEGLKIAKGIYLLPNLLTTAALFAGFSAVVAAMDGNFDRAGIAIFVAMVMDGLDGRVARLTSTESDFGKEYDSLADMISFGLAPALVVYQWGIVRLSELGWLWGKLGWITTFFYAVCAALRLARYNTRTGKGDPRFFEGLPSPSAAALTAALVWLGTELGLSGSAALIGGFLVTAIAGALMVSNFPYYSGKDLNLTRRVKFAYVLIIPLIFMVISLNPPVVLFGLFFAYAMSGPALALARRSGRQRRREQARASVDD